MRHRQTCAGQRWYHRLPPRVAPYRWVKRLVIAVFVPVFFIGYFAVQHVPIGEIRMMPVTPVDRMIGFAPSALILYVSLWIYIPIAAALLTRRRDVAAFTASATAIAVVGLLLFMVLPTRSPIAPIDIDAYPMFGFLRGTDHGRNACPSLHVAFAVLAAFWLARILREIGDATLGQAANVVWCLGIVYSTLATKQHVFVDVLGGGALALIVVGVERWLSKQSAVTDPSSHASRQD